MHQTLVRHASRVTRRWRARNTPSQRSPSPAQVEPRSSPAGGTPHLRRRALLGALPPSRRSAPGQRPPPPLLLPPRRGGEGLAGERRGSPPLRGDATRA
jgi:hypothetical protein